MRRILRHIPLMLAFALVLSVSCRKDQVKVIPRSELSEIYAEMLMTDQWILSTKGVRLIADTSLVYEPILEKYGYTTEDYLKTVDVYMDDPERFARVLRTTSEILDERLKQLQQEKKVLDAQVARERELKKMADMLKSDFDPAEFFPYLNGEPYVHYYDSVSFEPDSALLIYRLISIERVDTIYDRLRMVVKSDTLSVGDTIPAADTLAVPEVKIQSAIENAVLKGPLKNMDGEIRKRIVKNVEK